MTNAFGDVVCSTDIVFVGVMLSALTLARHIGFSPASSRLALSVYDLRDWNSAFWWPDDVLMWCNDLESHPVRCRGGCFHLPSSAAGFGQ